MMMVKPIALAAYLLLALCASAAANAQEAAKKEPPVVTLLERGAEPHAPLRLRPEAGEKGHRELRVSMTSKQGAGGQTMKMPTMHLLFTTKVDRVGEEGEIAYTLAFTKAEARDEPGVNPMMRQQVNAAIQAMTGLKIRAEMSDRGVMRKSAIEMPPDTDPLARQQMEGLADMIERFSAPLPAEPVGVGAKWKVESKIERQGMELKQTATYALKAVRGGMVELVLELSHDADPQDIKNPMMPPGATTRLLSYSGEGAGTLNLILSEVIHSDSRMSLTSDAKVSMSMAGQSQEMEQRMESEMSLSTAPEPEEDEAAE